MMMESNDQIPDDKPPSSLPPNLVVSVNGFPCEEAGQAMGRGMLTAVSVLGRYIDVSTLDGITVAVDYDAALHELDRSIEGLPPEERTNDEGLVGVGKAVLVRRGGEVKTHLVFDVGPVSCLAPETPGESDLGKETSTWSGQSRKRSPKSRRAMTSSSTAATIAQPSDGT
jgi:hypothetical protein